VPVGAGEDTGFDEEGNRVPNTNTFFYGQGWLESGDSFQKVKSPLANAAVRFLRFDLLNGNVRDLLDLSGDAVLHVSNIDDWFFGEWKQRMNVWNVAVMEQGGRLTIVTSQNGIKTLQADPHERAYRALLPHVSGRVVEVTHKVPWGFHEIPRINVTASEYLDKPREADTTILHILIGEGISQELFIAAYRKALEMSRWVLVMEHNRDSSDWDSDVRKRFVTETEMRNILEREAPESSAEITGVHRIAGETDEARNMLFVVDTGRKTMLSKPRVLLIADVPDWIFARHCRMLERYLATSSISPCRSRDSPSRRKNTTSFIPWNGI
jgi:hypothetical protein